MGMANITSVFQDALADQAKAALIDVVARNPRTTVKELAELVGTNPTLGGLTLAELVGHAADGRGRSGMRRGGTGRKAAASGGSVHKRNVRTESGRDAFDEEVLNALRTLGGDTVAATSLREDLNADPTQLRASLNRLIEKGVVTFTGKARGTRYSLSE